MGTHHFSWQPITSDMIGHEISLLVWPEKDFSIIMGGKQTLANKFEDVDAKLVALHCFAVDSVDDQMVTLKTGPKSVVVPLPHACTLDFCQVSEVCAGLGGTMAGATEVGLRPLIALDRSPLSCSLLRLNQVPVVLQGDLQNLHTLARFHLAHLTSRFGLLAGFPCQPFSSLGRALAFRDPRSKTLLFILDLAWLTQAAFLLLECVVGAGSNLELRAILDEFCAVRGFRMSSTILRLDNALPCRRTRWWCLLYPEWLPALEIPDIPRNPSRSVLQDVFPFWPVWPEHEELELKLTDLELDMYGNLDFGYSLEDRLLNMAGHCPTLLHSMGNVLRDCPRQCRGPISEALLRAQGLHGVVVKSVHPSVGFRHLHPKEAAFLLGVSAKLQTGSDLRGLLSQLGQIASPVQSHWMLSHFWTLFGLVDPAQLPQLHERFICKHICEHIRLWTPPEPFWNRIVEIHFPDGLPLQVRLTGPTTCLELLKAEAQLGREVESLCLHDALGVLAPHDWLIDFHITVTLRHGFGPLVASTLSCQGLDDLTMTREGQAMVEAAGGSASHFLSPRNLLLLLEMWRECARSLILTRIPFRLELHGFFLVSQHWIYFRCVPFDGVLLVHVYDGLRSSLSSEFVQVLHLLRETWGLAGVIWTFHCPIPQTFGIPLWFHCSFNHGYLPWTLATPNGN